MSKPTTWLSQVSLSDEEPRPYLPPLTVSEKAVIERLAEGLCLSVSSLAWAYHDNDPEKWKRLRRRLMALPVKLTHA